MSWFKKVLLHPSPLFDIELDHVVLDEIHLMMRITDRLTENIITEVMERDGKADFLKKKGRGQRNLPQKIDQSNK